MLPRTWTQTFISLAIYHHKTHEILLNKLAFQVEPFKGLSLYNTMILSQLFYFLCKDLT